MKVWKNLTEEEEEQCTILCEWSPCKNAMPVGERCVVNNKVMFAHHMDDQDGWEKNPSFHPLFSPGPKPAIEQWNCEFKHEYEKCKCHLELREHGQDESVYHSGDNPSSRWAVSGRSHAISKSRGVTRMVSAFKDYSKRGMCLKMNEDEIKEINSAREGKKYMDEESTPMEPLKESPSIIVIESTKDADGY